MFIVVHKKTIFKKTLSYVLALFCLIGVARFLAPHTITASTNTSGQSYVAIVIDDFGYNGEGTADMIALDVPLTAAVMPFSEHSAENAEQLKAAGKEMIIHMPMESLTGKKEWVGDKGVFTSMSEEQIQACVEEAFSIVPYATGLNNHMGSAIMEDERCFSAVMDVVAEKGLLFVDSMTTEKSVGDTVCHTKNIPVIKRDVFLDSTDDINVVKKQLLETATIAKERGYAVGIGHVGPEGGNITVEAIRELAPQLEQQGITFVTVSQLSAILSANS